MQPVYTAVQLMGTRYQKIYVINGLAYHAYIAAQSCKNDFGGCKNNGLYGTNNLGGKVPYTIRCLRIKNINGRG